MPRSYVVQPCRAELVAVVLAGTAHIVTELWLSERVALGLSGAMALAFCAYVVWRASTTAGALRAWGMRTDNLAAALRAHLLFALGGAVALVAIGAQLGTLAVSGSFWLTLGLYPIWGTAQQFALQNLIARNLAGMIGSPLGLASAAAVLFSASHFPRIDLMLLTLVAGVGFTLVYRRYPNLWAVGIAHGLLGALAVYLVAGEDPGAWLLEVWQRARGS